MDAGFEEEEMDTLPSMRTRRRTSHNRGEGLPHAEGRPIRSCTRGRSSGSNSPGQPSGSGSRGRPRGSGSRGPPRGSGSRGRPRGSGSQCRSRGSGTHTNARGSGRSGHPRGSNTRGRCRRGTTLAHTQAEAEHDGSHLWGCGRGGKGRSGVPRKKCINFVHHFMKYQMGGPRLQFDQSAAKIIAPYIENIASAVVNPQPQDDSDSESNSVSPKPSTEAGDEEVGRVAFARALMPGCNDVYWQVGYANLHIAAAKGYDEAVRLLILAGHDPNVRDRSGRTCLHIVASRGRVSGVINLFNLGVDPNARDREGRTALHRVCEQRGPQVASVLLDAGARVDERCDRGCTPLQAAIVRGDWDTVHFLILSGADINASDQRTHCLHYAMEQHGEVASDILLEAGADINLVDRFGQRTPLYAAVESGFQSGVKKLLKRGANVNALANGNRSPLHHAAERGTEEMLRILLEANADPNIMDEDQVTVLHISAARGRVGAVRLLLNYGAQVNARNAHLETPLHLASNISHDRIVQMLLPAGADTTARREDGCSAFDLATLPALRRLLRPPRNLRPRPPAPEQTSKKSLEE